MTQSTDKSSIDNQEPEVATTTATKAKNTSTTIAVVFDSSRKASQRRGLVINPKRSESTFAAVVTFAPLPTEDIDGNEFSMSIKEAEKIKLTYGLNMEVSLKGWSSLSGERFKLYKDSGAFEVYKPRKGREALTYADFEENDAIALVLGTISLAQLSKYSVGETRENVLREIREQTAAIQGSLNAIKAKNERSSNL